MNTSSSMRLANASALHPAKTIRNGPFLQSLDYREFINVLQNSVPAIN
jgi:hypothetical protein